MGREAWWLERILEEQLVEKESRADYGKVGIQGGQHW